MSEPKPAKLHTVEAQLLLAIDRANTYGQKPTYKQYGEIIGASEATIGRAIDRMVTAGWITTKKDQHHINITVVSQAHAPHGATIGNWIAANRLPTDGTATE